MENLTELDIQTLKTLSKKYFDMENEIEPLNQEFEEFVEKAKKDLKEKIKEKEKPILDKQEELELIKEEISQLLNKNNIDLMNTNKGKFKVYTRTKTTNFKKKEVKSNLAQLFSERLNTTNEENEELYKKTHIKEQKLEKKLKVLKHKKSSDILLL